MATGESGGADGVGLSGSQRKRTSVTNMRRRLAKRRYRMQPRRAVAVSRRHSTQAAFQTDRRPSVLNEVVADWLDATGVQIRRHTLEVSDVRRVVEGIC